MSSIIYSPPLLPSSPHSKPLPFFKLIQFFSRNSLLSFFLCYSFQKRVFPLPLCNFLTPFPSASFQFLSSPSFQAVSSALYLLISLYPLIFFLATYQFFSCNSFSCFLLKYRSICYNGFGCRRGMGTTTGTLLHSASTVHICYFCFVPILFFNSFSSPLFPSFSTLS